MLIKYYRDSNLAYASRKRYSTIGATAFAQEEQQAVKLGDGATTSIKTSASNICDYVEIGTSRWFVTSYYYMNGGQVTLNLQRDVIGENGLYKLFGKVDRGYTNSVLARKKELSLNQILKYRKSLKSSATSYGNYSINNHTNEMWGILYFNKPSDNAEKITIPIAAQDIQIMDYGFIENNSIRYYSKTRINEGIGFNLYIHDSRYSVGNGAGNWSYYIYINKATNSYTCSSTNYTSGNNKITVTIPSSYANKYYDQWAKDIAESLLYKLTNNQVNGFSSPSSYPLYNLPKYNDVVISYDNSYLKYTQSFVSNIESGTIVSSSIISDIVSQIRTSCNNIFTVLGQNGQAITSITYPDNSILTAVSNATYNGYRYTYIDVTNQVKSSEITINASNLFVDEPFYICLIPLYGVSITGNMDYYDKQGNLVQNGVDTVIVDKSVAFRVFNEIISKSSGDNSYLVDAQIYPYCPVLSTLNCLYAAETGEDANHNKIYTNVPIFNIDSTSYETICSVSLNPYSDIKKEYIAREYAIVDTMKTSKFNFNYYDYFNEVHSEINIKIKTALKPFSIISSAVLTRDSDCISGITFPSDINGCISSGGAYECSIASDAFETYARQNSNYQELFNLDKSELEYQHKVELANDIVSSVTNTMSASMMGAIAGASAADVGLLNVTGSKAAGAAIGGTVAGAVVGSSMAGQTIANQKLREYESYLQQARFDLTIGTIKNLPNSVTRVSSFNEIAMSEFYYSVEIYECSDVELNVIDTFISNCGYIIGVYGNFEDYFNQGWFLKGELMKSELITNLHNIARNELAGGIYLYE